MCPKHLVKTEVLQNWNDEFSKWLNPKFYATIQAEKKPCHQNSLSFEMKLGCKEVGRLFLGLSYICLPTHIHTTSMPLDNLKEVFFFKMFLANVKLGKPFSHQMLWMGYIFVVLDSNYAFIFWTRHFHYIFCNRCLYSSKLVEHVQTGLGISKMFWIWLKANFPYVF